MKFFNSSKEKKKQTESETVDPAASEDSFFREVDIEFLIHELKDPLTIIETGLRTVIERPEKYGDLTSKQEKTLKRTLRNCKKARGMINHLLEIGRSQSGCFFSSRFSPADTVWQALVDALETVPGDIFEAFSRIENRKKAMAYLVECGVTLKVSPNGLNAEMVQDETKFRQIVGNLIKNAFHHRREKISIDMDATESEVLVTVADDGQGVEAEHHQFIFQRYTRLQECSLPPRSGHGLGLAGARILARCLGGDIHITSEKGKGATFHLAMPLAMPNQ